MKEEENKRKGAKDTETLCTAVPLEEREEELERSLWRSLLRLWFLIWTWESR